MWSTTASPGLVRKPFASASSSPRSSAKLTERVEAILDSITVLPFEAPADLHYADIRRYLETAGDLIGPNDLLIAAHARALDLTLVTANFTEFSRVPELRVENWLG